LRKGGSRIPPDFGCEIPLEGLDPVGSGSRFCTCPGAIDAPSSAQSLLTPGTLESRTPPNKYNTVNKTRHFPGDFIERPKTLKSDTQNAQEFLIPLSQRRAFFMNIQRLKHPDL
jgi:hypothetical protein